MFVFQFVTSDDGKASKEEFLRQLCRNVANTMYRPDPDTYLVRMRPDDLGLSNSDLSVNRNYRNMYKVKKVFSFNRTPTSSRLTRAVSSMISPLTSSNGHNQMRDRITSTPSGDLQNLRLQSCSNLADAASSSSNQTESPRSTRRFRMMPPPPASPSARSVASSNGSTSDAESTPTKREKGGFALPRTPSICVRRSSFKFITNSLAKKF
jgi:hypothetical protein